MDESAVGTLRSKLFMAGISDDRHANEAAELITEWIEQQGLSDCILNAAGPLVHFFLATYDWAPEETANRTVEDLAALLRSTPQPAASGTDGERTADSKADGKKNSWPKTPENPKVAQLAKKIRSNPDPKRSKVDIAREFAKYNEREAQSLLRKLRDFPHLLNTADT
jgi:hypothetical protein